LGTGAVFTGTGLDLPGGSSATQAYGDLPNFLISSQTAVTIEGWITIDSTDQNWARIFDFGSSNLLEVNGPGGGGTGTDYFLLSASRGTNYNQQRIEIRNEDPAGGGFATFDSDVPTLPGDSFHFAVTWEDTGVGTSRVNNWLGRSNWTGDANTNATYDEFRIYDTALSEQQVTSSMSAGPETVINLNEDSDGDQIPDAYEEQYGFLDPADPNDAALDQDSDGLTNLEEFQLNTNPDDDDSDGDGLSDGEEVNTYSTLPRDPDSDDDGLTDGEEVNTTNTLPLDADSDGDGIDDGVETQLAFLDPNNAADALLDGDSDGLNNLQEVQAGTLLDNADTDADGLSDGDEVNVTNTLPLNADSDNDWINDGPEIAGGTDPFLSDATNPTPIHRYSFNEAAGPAAQGSVVTDSIGGADGVIVGSNGSWTGARLFLPGGDGATADAAYVDLPNGLLSARDHLTFEAWYSVRAIQNWSRVWDFGSSQIGEVNSTVSGASAGLDYFICAANRGLDINTQRLSVRNNDPVTPGGGNGPVDNIEEAADSGLPTVLGQEYHVVGIWTSDGSGGGQITFYRDGVRQSTTLTTFTPWEINDINNWLGSNFTGDGYLPGDLNEFRIYEGAMNDAAVQASFAAGPDAIIGSGEIQITSIQYDQTTNSVSLTFMLPSVKICESGHSTGSRSTGVSPVYLQGNSVPTGETPEILESTNPHARWYSSVPWRLYSVLWSTDLMDFSNELVDAVPADGTSTTVGPIALPEPAVGKLFFRISN
jgi:hypothetical protein